MTERRAPVLTAARREAQGWLERGRPDLAISILRRALAADPADAQARLALGRAYLAAGWPAEARDAFGEAAGAAPGLVEAHQGLAGAHLALGNLGEARRASWRALALRLRRALPAFLRWDVGAAVTPPQDAGAADRLLEQARAASISGQLEEALGLVEAALRHDPGSAPVLAAAAGVLHPWNDARAEALARRALAIDPELGSAHTNLAAALWGQGRLEEAERHCRAALARDPGLRVNRLNLALILRHAGRLEQAAQAYRALLPEALADARFCTEYGNLLVESGGDPAEARGLFRRAQALPGGERAALFEAALDLLLGNFAAGWERYEARRQGFEAQRHRAYAAHPQWRGEALGAGEGLLVYGEQSLGDQIMFASMLPEVLARAPAVTLLCEPRLQALLARSFPGVTVLADPPQGREARLAGLAGVSRQIAAGSLGRLLRGGPGDFPSHDGYLRAEPSAVRAWRERLEALGPGLKAGISWRGGTQGTGLGRRSIPAPMLAALDQPGVRWVSLQHGAPHAGVPPLPLAAFPGATDDIDQLAALCAALDLVVSVCNTNVHVCGALGREVWVLAPLVPEWRYGRSGERMLWYPAARVLRQTRHGDWAPVLAEAARRLRARAAPPAQGA